MSGAPDLTLTPIGVVRTPFPEKFGIPRQARLVRAARGVVELDPRRCPPDAVRGLDDSTHLWLVVAFARAGRGATVRPPRFGGNARRGVLATRSPFRPNPIGLSLVELDRVDVDGGRVSLHVAGVDLLDGTPVLDVKPYLPWADAVPDAAGPPPPTTRAVTVEPEAEERLAALEAAGRPDLRRLAVELLAHDPRPAYHTAEDGPRRYGMSVFDVDVRFRVDPDGGLRITDVALVDPAEPGA